MNESYGLIETSNERLRESRNKYRTATIVLVVLTILLTVLTIVFAVYTYKYYLFNFNFISLEAGPACPKKFPPVPFATFSQSKPYTKLQTQLQSTLTSTLNDANVASVYVAATYQGNTILSTGSGSATPNISDDAYFKNINPPNATTLFRMADLTSIFPVLAFLQQVEKSTMQPDDPISKYFNVSQTAFDQITLRMLASHTSGLPLAAPCDPKNCVLTTQQILSQPFATQLVSAPGTVSSYSRYGIALLGHAVAAATNSRSFDQYITDNIIVPLNLTRTFRNITMAGGKDIANGSRRNSTDQYVNVDQYDMGWMSPAAQYYTNANDMIVLMNALLSHSDKLDLSEMMFAPSSAVDGNGLSVFAMPFVSVLRKHTWAYAVVGSLNGFSASMVLVPSMQVGIVTLINEESDASIFPMALINDLVPGLQSIFEANQSGNNQPPNAQAFVGTFEYNNATVIVSQGKNGLEVARGGATSPFAQLSFVSKNGPQVILSLHNANTDINSCLNNHLAALDGERAIFTFTSADYTKVVSLTMPGLNFGVYKAQ